MLKVDAQLEKPPKGGLCSMLKNGGHSQLITVNIPYYFINFIKDQTNTCSRGPDSKKMDTHAYFKMTIFL